MLRVNLFKSLECNCAGRGLRPPLFTETSVDNVCAAGFVYQYASAFSGFNTATIQVVGLIYPVL